MNMKNILNKLTEIGDQSSKQQLNETISITADGNEGMTLVNMLKLAGQPVIPSATPPVSDLSMDTTIEEIETDMYANTPDEKVCDTETMLSGGNDLHKEKGAYYKANGGDNAMALEARLKKMFNEINESSDDSKKDKHDKKDKESKSKKIKESIAMGEAQHSFQPKLVFVDDYHEFADVQKHLQIIDKGYRVKEVTFSSNSGMYVGVVYHISKVPTKVEINNMVQEKGISEAKYEKDISDKEPVIVKGVKGMDSKPFTKKFKNMAAYEKWADSEEAGNYEVRTVEKAH